MPELETWRISEFEAARKRQRENAEAWHTYHEERAEQIEREAQEHVAFHRDKAAHFGNMLTTGKIPDPEIPRDMAAWM